MIFKIQSYLKNLNPVKMFFRSFLVFSAFLFIVADIMAQEPLKYQLPPDEIVKIADAPQTPDISVSPDKSSIILIELQGLLTIADLSEEELRIAGLRINPSNSGPGRQKYNTGFRIMNIDGSNIRDIDGLPDNPKFGNPVWSADSKKFAFTNTTSHSIELWLCDIELLRAEKIADNLNQIFGNAFRWLSDSKRILYYVSDPDRGNKPVHDNIPKGPIIRENIGKKSQARTYQDLLKDPADELLFEYYVKSQLCLWDGNKTLNIGRPAMITEINPSPDGKYFLINTLKRPFSYMVPYRFFPSNVEIWDITGNIIKTLAEIPLTENVPREHDAVLPGPRSFSWRSDKPSTIYWVEALDEGNYENEMEYHDQVYYLDAPFNDPARKLIATRLRYSGITWGKDDFALITERLSKTRKILVSSFIPSDPQQPVQKIHDYFSDDGYANPGNFMLQPNIYGRSVLLFTNKGKSLYLTGRGASTEGDRPFLDRYDIQSGKTTRLWRSSEPYFETVYFFTDISKNLVFTNRQSTDEIPNYFIRNIKNGKMTQVTSFEDPCPFLKGITKELVSYKRNDGVDLSYMLYLPANYPDKPLPTLLWAYPREFNDPAAAGQVSGSPYLFNNISPLSALVYVTQGYAILMDASFPIIKTDDREPNDTYIEQLIANAEAAVNKAVEMGVADPDRIAVSGHSYGAFMTANLLANTRLFAAGIASSGAYNRTLTPFGFQSEKRTYWDVPEVYNRMSPFMHADKVKDPILLIHGTDDNNEGTFPIQSERFFAALKGFGATARLVLLPNESHGYAARESILHRHWETLSWMNKYLKDK